MTNRTTRLAVLAATVLTCAGCQTDLYSGLAETQANEVMAALLAHDIDVDKTVDRSGTYTLSIGKSDLADAMAILSACGLPRETFANTNEIFASQGLVASPLTERVRFIYALEQNLSATLSQIDGVITARAHIVLPENDPFAQYANPSSASVFIKHRPQSELADIKSRIKLIVEKSIEGLEYDKVSVVMLPARPVEACTVRISARG